MLTLKQKRFHERLYQFGLGKRAWQLWPGSSRALAETQGQLRRRCVAVALPKHHGPCRSR